jgi:hypothetical protein
VNREHTEYQGASEKTGSIQINNMGRGSYSNKGISEY